MTKMEVISPLTTTSLYNIVHSYNYVVHIESWYISMYMYNDIHLYIRTCIYIPLSLSQVMIKQMAKKRSFSNPYSPKNSPRSSPQASPSPSPR